MCAARTAFGVYAHTDCDCFHVVLFDAYGRLISSVPHDFPPSSLHVFDRGRHRLRSATLGVTTPAASASVATAMEKKKVSVTADEPFEEVLATEETTHAVTSSAQGSLADMGEVELSLIHI